ncbi:MAG TPA: hypothetical protein VFH80_02635 [Solirubrobacteraceae bacterium]|nr:hypothetical protein [Solirubrobacteraceae bacterium]
MNAGDSSADDLSPAERRLTQHLELLRESPPATPALVPRVIRGVRWQRAIRDPLVLVGSVAAAAVEWLELVFGRPGDRS